MVIALVGCSGASTEGDSSTVNSSSIAVVSSIATQSSRSVVFSSTPAVNSSIAVLSSSVPSSIVASSTPSGTSSSTVTVQGDFAKGATIYKNQCENCHKVDGKGFGIDLTSLSAVSYQNSQALADYNEECMPRGSVDDCIGDCAVNVTRYIVDHYKGISWDGVTSSSAASSEPVIVLPEPVWDEALREGMNEWDAQCSSCHGPSGVEQPPQDLANGRGRIDVTSWIGKRGNLVSYNYDVMPFRNTSAQSQAACDQACAEKVSDYILANFPRPAIEAATCEGDITDHLNPPIRSLTTVQYSQLVDSVFAPLNLNTDNLIPDELMKDFKAGGFTNNAAVVVDGNNFEQLLDVAEQIANHAGNNFSKLMSCGTGEACVRNFITQYGTKLFRVAPTAAQLDELIGLYKSGTQIQGIQYVVTAMLLSPQAIYHYENNVNQRKALTAVQLAARLSFMLWNEAPSQPLIDQLKNIDRSNANAVAAVAEEMLSDDKVAKGIGQFYKDYLHIEADFNVVAGDGGSAGGALPTGECGNTTQCKQMYNGATDCKNSAGGVCYCGNEVCAQLGGNGGDNSGVQFGINGTQAADEVKRFATYLTTQSNGSFSDLLLSRKAFVDDATANVYGVTGQTANANTYLGGKEVTLSAGERAGLLTRIGFVIHGGGTAVGLASPTERGKLVRETVLCQGLPPAPGDVEFPDLPDPAETTWVEVVKTIHLKGENACTTCHKPMDPVGFAFENYTLNGEFIDTYPNGQPVDASGWFEKIDAYQVPLLDDGEFKNAIEMSQMIAAAPEAAACFGQTWSTYAFAREVENDNDICAVDQVNLDFKNKNYSLKELIISIVRSPAFRFRNPESN